MMRSILMALAFVVVAVVLLWAVFTVISGSSVRPPDRSIVQGARFPIIRGQNLRGKDFEFPKDFSGKRTLILIAYERDQADALSSWVKGLDLLQSQLQWFETPVISKPLQLGRAFIDGGMRSGIPDLRLQERVVTLYTNRESFSDSLGIPFDQQGVYAMVVNPDGRVVGYVQGAYNLEGAQKIEGWLTSGR